MLLLVSPILPSFRLAAIIFFFCKIFCKQRQQKAIIKKGKKKVGIMIRKKTHCHRHTRLPVSPHAAVAK
jgi:hypothetical protein